MNAGSAHHSTPPMNRLVALVACIPFVMTPGFGSPELELELQQSTNLADWQTVPVSPEMITPTGRLNVRTENHESLFFRMQIAHGESVMVPVEGGSLPALSGLGELAVNAFLIGRYEVTWTEWQAVRDWAAQNGYDIEEAGAGCEGDHPVHSVSWYDAVKWCNAKSEKEKRSPVYRHGGEVYRSGHSVPDFDPSADGFRLPTEAEWEFAARGGNLSEGHTYSGSDLLDSVAWHWANAAGAPCDMWGGRGTWPVGQKQANELGLHDMSGNVWEWCWDEDNGRRRLRGGSWGHDGTAGCALSARHAYFPSNSFDDYGLRLARSPEPSP